MADKKFDQFTDGGEMQIGDIPVGLRSSDLTKNFQFDFPGNGIKDSSGNYLFQYATAGAAAVNYLKFTNSASTLPAILGSGGTDANISISIVPKGSGSVHIPAIVDQVTQLDVGNLRLAGNTLSSTDSNGNINIVPDGSGHIILDDIIIDDLSNVSGVASIVLSGSTSGTLTLLATAISGTNTITFPAATGTVALTGSSVASIQGTANQVLVNGTSGSPVTGAITLATPQDIATTSSPTFAGLTLSSPLTVANGGTGLSTLTVNGVLYASGATTMSQITPANSAVFVTNSSGVPALTGPLSNGQLIIGSTGATPATATLTAGANISIVNGAGSITISATGLAGFSWTTVSGTSQNMLSNNGYIADNAGLVTLNLPASSAVGDEIDIIGKGAGGWLVQCGGGQTIVFGASTTSSGGSIASTHAKDSFYMICTVANTEWTIASAPQSSGLTIL